MNTMKISDRIKRNISSIPGIFADCIPSIYTSIN